MYWVMDLYGQVPFRTPDEGPDVNPNVMSRTEVYAMVEQDFKDALAALPDLPAGDDDSRGLLNQLSLCFSKTLFECTRL